MIPVAMSIPLLFCLCCTQQDMHQRCFIITICNNKIQHIQCHINVDYTDALHHNTVSQLHLNALLHHEHMVARITNYFRCYCSREGSPAPTMYCIITTSSDLLTSFIPGTHSSSLLLELVSLRLLFFTTGLLFCLIGSPVVKGLKIRNKYLTLPIDIIISMHYLSFLKSRCSL